MDNEKKKSRKRIFRNWFKRKHKKADPYYLGEVADWGEDEGNNYETDVFTSPMEDEERVPNTELRVFVGTWNVAGRSPIGSLAVDVDEWLNLKDDADIYALGFQEIVPLKAKNVIGAEDPTEAVNWNQLIRKILNNRYGCPWLTPTSTPIMSYDYQYSSVFNSDQPQRSSKYKLMASKKMVGVFITVWIKRELLTKYNVSSAKICSVPCGIWGYLGNKGAVSVSLSIEGASFCFIAAHLASGEKKGSEGRRNRQVSEIFRRTIYSRLPQDGDNYYPLTIEGHDRVFWFGDLNYRLCLEDNFARVLIRKRQWNALREFDQLQRELEDGGVFQGWSEGNIEFAPTYKYSTSNCNRYSGGLPKRAGEKRRTPAWCDRILWYGKGVEQMSYFRSESKFSDHRPVSALFSTQISLKSNVSRANPCQEIIPKVNFPPYKGKAKEKATSTLISLIVKDLDTPPRRNLRL